MLRLFNDGDDDDRRRKRPRSLPRAAADRIARQQTARRSAPAAPVMYFLPEAPTASRFPLRSYYARLSIFSFLLQCFLRLKRRTTAAGQGSTEQRRIPNEKAVRIRAAGFNKTIKEGQPLPSLTLTYYQITLRNDAWLRKALQPKLQQKFRERSW